MIGKEHRGVVALPGAPTIWLEFTPGRRFTLLAFDFVPLTAWTLPG